jgi:hypothetical protein
VDRSDKEWTISSQQKKTKKRRDPQHDLSDSPSASPAGPSRTTEGGAKDGPSAGGGGAKGRAGKRRKTAKKAEDEMVDSFEFDEVWDVEVSVLVLARVSLEWVDGQLELGRWGEWIFPAFCRRAQG